jgi:hypothetical protein
VMNYKYYVNTGLTEILPNLYSYDCMIIIKLF